MVNEFESVRGIGAVFGPYLVGRDPIDLSIVIYRSGLGNALCARGEHTAGGTTMTLTRSRRCQTQMGTGRPESICAVPPGAGAGIFAVYHRDRLVGTGAETAP